MGKILIFCESLPGAFLSRVGEEAKGHRGRVLTLSPLDLLSQRPKEGLLRRPFLWKPPRAVLGEKGSPHGLYCNAVEGGCFADNGMGFCPHEGRGGEDTRPYGGGGVEPPPRSCAHQPNGRRLEAAITGRLASAPEWRRRRRGGLHRKPECRWGFRWRRRRRR